MLRNRDKFEKMLKKHLIERRETSLSSQKRAANFLSTIGKKQPSMEKITHRINVIREKKDLLKISVGSLAVLIFLTTLCYHENEYHPEKRQILSQIYLHLLFFLTICFSVCKALSTILYNQLLIEENLLSKKNSTINAHVFLSFVLYLIHPTILLHGISVNSDASFPPTDFERPLNDYLLILQCTIVFYEILKQSLENPRMVEERARMIVRNNHFNSSFNFRFRYSFKMYPVSFVTKLIVIGSIYLSFMLKISESPQGISDISFLNYWCNSIWLTFVTMLTIGYGDYRPISFLGRFFGILIGIFGYIFFSLVITAINTEKDFSKSESKTYYLLERLHHRKVMQEKAAVVIGKMARCYLAYINNRRDQYTNFQRQFENSIIQFKDSRMDYSEVGISQRENIH